MYSPDTLVRLNDERVRQYWKNKGEDKCDYCLENDPVQQLKYYNPADSVRGIEGVYATELVCQECLDNDAQFREGFYCPGCGKLFVRNHSWDYLAVKSEWGEEYCQECYIRELLEPILLGELIDKLHAGETGDFKRINNIPDKELLYEGEFSQYSDFPGHTSLSSIATVLEVKAVEEDISLDSLVYPVITHTYQFSLVVGVFID